jgi:hypothetical protein
MVGTTMRARGWGWTVRRAKLIDVAELTTPHRCSVKNDRERSVSHPVIGFDVFAQNPVLTTCGVELLNDRLVHFNVGLHGEEIGAA